MLVPCELLDGHKIEKIEGKDILNNKISIPWCIKCKRIVNLNYVDLSHIKNIETNEKSIQVAKS